MQLAGKMLPVSSGEWCICICIYEMTECSCEGDAYSSVTDTLQVQVATLVVSPFGMSEYVRSVTNVIFFVCVVPRAREMKYYTLNINGVFIA